MAKADRLERMEVRRIDLEAEYREALIAALEVCAGGQWGLFDHQQDKVARGKVAPVLADLQDLAETIDGLREQLGMEAFALHAEFLAARGPVKSSAVGEPKQAAAWLARLNPSG
jgi:hypothetical protein